MMKTAPIPTNGATADQLSKKQPFNEPEITNEPDDVQEQSPALKDMLDKNEEAMTAMTTKLPKAQS